MSTASLQKAEQPPMGKTFDPSSYEAKWQEHWSEQGYFTVDATADKSRFCIMIPPPNVTGILHIGHALQTTLQDLLTRWKRMKGFEALWLPGTDHAGIATQLMVEQQLTKEGNDREEMGREKFLERMWEWRHEHHGHIRTQLDLLGASCDWSRERFTLDEGLSRAVREAFVRLSREGLIRRDEYMVNWSPNLNTAISDLEVEMKTVQGHLWHIAYPVEGSDERIVVATTRPETMLGDTAVALHPEDERYAHLRGKHAILPLMDRRIPFIEDEVVEREFGTGLVKVTPSHDPADFEMGRRHDLDFIQVIDRRGRMTAAAGDFAGLDRFEAREKVVERLEAEGYLVEVEPYQHNVGHSQRGGEPVEPLVSTQWFCDVSGMARRALEANRSGDLTLIPDTHDKTWEHWLENIRPWCISRQLWWGHRIPAWYDEDGNVYVAHSEEEARQQAEVQGVTGELRQDEDVLDTWFSSALWPFSTLGWPDETEDFRAFYPNDVLVTGFDILFFWVARMVMTGLHFTDRVPFHTVHLTGLVRDAEGQKMSKTRGNVVDPRDVIERHGADALRFTLAILDVPGRDIPLDEERIAGYRAFGNKIWNATRFALSRIEQLDEDAAVQRQIGADEVAALAPPERWILSRLSKTAAEVDDRLEAFRFDQACERLYHFFWGELCDWYIELSKPAFFGEQRRPRVGDVLLTVLDRSLRLLHPVMPFLTEEVWQRLPGREVIDDETIVLAPYPEPVEAWEDDEVEAEIGALIEIVTRLRGMRAELAIPPKDPVKVHLGTENESLATFLHHQEPLMDFLVRLEGLDIGGAEAMPENAVKDLVAGVGVGLVYERELGEEERRRLEKELEKIEGEIRGAESRLSNEQFLAKAPEAVVQGNRERLAELRERRERVLAGLDG